MHADRQGRSVLAEADPDPELVRLTRDKGHAPQGDTRAIACSAGGGSSCGYAM